MSKITLCTNTNCLLYCERKLENRNDDNQRQYFEFTFANEDNPAKCEHQITGDVRNIFKSFLVNGDSIKKLSSIQKIELKDYVNMRKKGFPSRVHWEELRSNWVTENGRTIWQLSEAFFNSAPRAAGMFDPPVALIEWILEESDLLQL